LLFKADTSSSTRPSKQSNARKERPLCTHCGLYGHIVEKCYKLHGFPPGFKFNKPHLAGSAPANTSANFSAHQVQNSAQPHDPVQLSVT
jgi:hypothetical protein